MNNVARSIIILLATLPIFVYAAKSYNAGFVSGIWYSKTPFFAGETVRIYTAFQNHSGGDIVGKVGFFDNNTLIGETSFSAINDRLIETWIDWTVTYGNHTISAKIINPKRSEAGKPQEEVIVLSGESRPETIFIDKDTDNDGIGDETDPDIDNDGLSNIEEKQLGTDLTRVDTDNDGIPDKDDPAPLSPVSLTKEEMKIQSNDVDNGTANPVTSFTENIINAVNRYADSLEQKISVWREEIMSNIKSIDDTRERVDTDHDGLIGLADFNIFMVNWGKKGINIADYNYDETVDLIDFNILMIYWS